MYNRSLKEVADEMAKMTILAGAGTKAEILEKATAEYELRCGLASVELPPQVLREIIQSTIDRVITKKPAES